MALVHFPPWRGDFGRHFTSKLALSFPCWLYSHTGWSDRGNVQAHKKSMMHREHRRSENRREGCGKVEKRTIRQEGIVKENREKPEESEIMMTICVYVDVCDVHHGMSQLWAMGPLAGLSFVSSWDWVFHSSAPSPATLLLWPKHSPVSSSTLLLLLLQEQALMSGMCMCWKDTPDFWHVHTRTQKR